MTNCNCQSLALDRWMAREREDECMWLLSLSHHGPLPHRSMDRIVHSRSSHIIHGRTDVFNGSGAVKRKGTFKAFPAPATTRPGSFSKASRAENCTADLLLCNKECRKAGANPNHPIIGHHHSLPPQKQGSSPSANSFGRCCQIQRDRITGSARRARRCEFRDAIGGERPRRRNAR